MSELTQLVKRLETIVSERPHSLATRELSTLVAASELLIFQALQIKELEAQLSDAEQAARWESDLAGQALSDLEPYRKDAERYQRSRRDAVELSLSNDTIAMLLKDQTELDKAIAGEAT